MDLLRRIFGLQPAPEELQTAPPPETPTAEQVVAEPAATSPSIMEELGRTKIPPDDGHTHRLPDIDSVLGTTRNGRRLLFGVSSDVGQIRNTNQDAVFTFLSTSVSSESHPEVGVFILADGMGGHHDGERASAIAARTVARYTSAEIMMPVFRKEEPNPDRPTITEILRAAIQHANIEVSKEVPEGGTTVTAAAVVGDLAYIGHVGDSRAYMITSDSIEQLTRDHSLVQRLIELDQLTPEEALDHPQRNVLYRAIGQNENIDVDAITRRLTPGSRLLLCSDGLWNLVPEQELRTTVISTPSPQSACEALVKLANARGGHDNISVLIVKMPE